MDRSLHGATQNGAVTAPESKNSSGCQAVVKPTKEAFAAILQDGSVISWGFGGVILRLDPKNVQEVQATDRAFVVDWGGQASIHWIVYGKTVKPTISPNFLQDGAARIVFS